MTPLADRMPPHSIDAEQGVLGAMILNDTAIHEVTRIVQPKDFFRDSHIVIATAIWDMVTEGRPVDWMTLSDELTRRGESKILGENDCQTIADLIEATPCAYNATEYASIVRGHSARREAIEWSNQTIREAYALEETPEVIIARAAERLRGIERGGETRMHLAVDLLPEVYYRIRQRQDGIITGVHTGLRDLDDMTDGFQPQDFVILAARPSMGKTSLALNVADYVAVANKKPTLFVSLEMGNPILVERLAISRSQVPSAKVRNGGKIEDDEWQRLETAYEAIATAPLYLIKRPGRTLVEVIHEVRRARASHGVELVIIDYLQLIRSGNPKESEVQSLTRISGDLKGLANDLEIPIFTLSQLNRQLEGREEKTPRMADLRGSGTLEQDADLVLLLHRPEYFDATDRPGTAELIVAKNRNGQTGAMTLTFLKDQMRFFSYSDAEQPVTYGHANRPF
jgi:replicative DNA helicase